MIITMTQAHTFIKKGDIPIEKILLMMRFFSFQKSGRKRTKLSLSRKCFTTHTIPINCEITVAVAAPRIPQSKWKIKIGATRAGEKLDLVSLDDYLKGLSNVPAGGGSDGGSGDNSGDGGLDENPLG